MPYEWWQKEFGVFLGFLQFALVYIVCVHVQQLHRGVIMTIDVLTCLVCIL